jgi:UDP-2-acetamido-3-amino-2,3-dideoxy-glucuronate N-acetyltransferase
MSDAPFIHDLAICDTCEVGARTRVWPWAHVFPGARIGADCNICEHVLVEDDVVVGDRVTIKSGVQLWNGIVIGDDVFIGPNATFTNDPFPRSRHPVTERVVTRIDDGASVGANATVLPGVRVGRAAMIGAGSVVTRDVPPNAIIAGNPARITGYVGAEPEASEGAIDAARQPASSTALSVGGAAVLRLRRFGDLRGELAVAELPADLPFMPSRVFLVFDVPSAMVRGEHAHRQCEQVLMCIHGHVTVVLDDGASRVEVSLDSPEFALHIPAMLWATQYRHSPDATLLVFASHAYDPEDYIRDYEEFLALCEKRTTG